jgi:predicted DNA-binding transcriptional regulator AlpA
MSLSRDDTPLPGVEDTERLLSRAEVCRIVNLSFPTVWKMMRAGTFPCPLRTAPNRVGWLRSEVLAHIRSLKRQDYKT